MCNNILQYGHVYAWARENHRHCMSMRFAYKYQYFNICKSKHHNWLYYLAGKYLSKWKLMKIVTYFLYDPDMSAKEDFIRSHKNVVVEGWGVRYFDLFKKYKDEIQQLFGFQASIESKIDSFMSRNSGADTIKIGVHIRRGDYKTFFNGIYYYEDDVYLNFIKQTIALHKDKRCTVYICGNDPKLSHSYYEKNLRGVDVLFPQGNPGEDLCLLSKCDYLIGPPSSFSLIATMYDRARLCWMDSDDQIVTEESFKDFDTLSPTFDDYWVNEPKPKACNVMFLISRYLDGGIDSVITEYINNMVNLTDYNLTLVINVKMDKYEVFLSRLPKKVKVIYLVHQHWLTWYKLLAIKKKNQIYGLVDEMLLNPLRRLETKVKLQGLIKRNDVLIDFDSTFGAYISSKSKIRKIAFFHFSFDSEMKRNPKHMTRVFNHMHKFDKVVTISDAMLEEGIKLRPELNNKFVRIYNSISEEHILKQAEMPVRNPFFNLPFMLAVERLEESQKDLTTLITAYAVLRRRYMRSPEFKASCYLPILPKLYIIGEGKSRKHLADHILKLGLSHDVYLLGFISNPFPWMRKAEFIVHSSKFEGLPTVLIESLMLDKLIISTDCPTGPREILNNGKAGMLVPVGRANDMAMAIQRLLTDSDLRKSLHEDIQRHKSVFFAEKNIRSLEQLFYSE